jgi:ABC-type transporter Mla maintaining outer membrane lipid asymmetry ATPase subunit MlaF
MTASPAIEIIGVTKSYAALRPLRIAALAVAQGQRVALSGIDAGGAELVVNLVTGASLPDEGEVRIFGRRTSEIPDGDEWLSSLDRFGIVSERGVLLEGSTVMQNLALPFTLEIDPIPAETSRQVRAIAAECGIAVEWMDCRAGEVPPAVRARLHLARALALGPQLLLLEHPTAAILEAERAAFGSVVARVCESRGLTALAITFDSVFAGAAAHRTLTLQPATGQLVSARRGWWRGRRNADL